MRGPLEITATRMDAYQLFHDATLVLADIEHAGMCVDRDYIEEAIKDAEKQIDECTEELLETEFGREWKNAYGEYMDFDKNQQIADVLYVRMGCKAIQHTDTGAPSTSAEALEDLKVDGIGEYVRIKRLMKAISTYLTNLRSLQVDGYLHPDFLLHTAISYRSSSRNPNFQNIPVRDKEMKALVRSAFIPEPGHQILEADFKSAEVSIAACYHRDQNMIDYILDSSKDMHRDMACQIFMIDVEDCSKDTRYAAKNGYVFPQFYGDWYKSCAKYLWDNIRKLNLELLDGTSMRKHLEDCHIHNYKQFERHMQGVEQDFWGNRFADYQKWKEGHYEQYLENGYIDSLTGFRYSGVMRRNQVINYPVQGSAFHCLLWVMIKMHKFLGDKNSRIIGQIHDSLVIDLDPAERDEVIEEMQSLMIRIRRHWDWIIVPLSVEFDLAPVDGSWCEKKEYEV